ncbi:MAG: alanine racemase [Hydrogenothermaceae bacterium]|nr:alanine racemase [Hydrogenothermaceae bacterium]
MNLNNLIENLVNIHRFSNKYIFAVVKADAYGHDAKIVSKILEDIPFIKKLCVATPIEAKELREIGITKDILVLGGILKGEEDLFLKYNLIPVVSTFENLSIAKSSGIRKIHLKFDTGMGRLGFFEEDISFLKDVIKDFEVEGVMTHFPSADIDVDFTEIQIKKFKDIVTSLNIHPKHIHIQNSAGVMYNCDYCTDVRIGLSMYGEKPCDNFPIPLKNVMSVYAKVISVKHFKKGTKISYCGTYTTTRDIKAGVISFGYADGLPRLLSNKGNIIINGKKADIIGNITMDMTIVDISDIDTKVGDDAIIVGEDGSAKITFTDIAKLSGTIPYEIMCGISKRVVRIVERG